MINSASSFVSGSTKKRYSTLGVGADEVGARTFNNMTIYLIYSETVWSLARRRRAILLQFH